MTTKHLTDEITEVILNKNSTTRYYTHLGGTLLSDECMRRSAYRFRWAAPIEYHNEKTLRIFELGKAIEGIVLKWLADASGIELTENSLSDSQEQIKALHGHFTGHLDGILKIDGKPYIIEIKSHNDASFQTLLKNNVEESHLSHYLQCQTYMHFSDIKDCLYIAYNKNNSDIHMAHIPYNADIGSDLEKRAMSILFGEESYPRIAMYKCKKFGGCAYFNICHSHGLLLKNCRTCVSLEPADEGQWCCTKKDKAISLDEQERGCREYIQRIF